MAEPASDDHSIDNGDVARYEALRAQALGGEAAGWRLGLALFQGRGIAAWLRAARSIPSVRSQPAQQSATSGELDEDLVGVLAAMALAVVG